MADFRGLHRDHARHSATSARRHADSWRFVLRYEAAVADHIDGKSSSEVAFAMLVLAFRAGLMPIPNEL
jgi:hypothetical protein